jgi:hypothetical protein
MKANVIQAREEMERDKGVKNPFAILTGKRRNKDEYLSKYFKNRDIVSIPLMGFAWAVRPCYTHLLTLIEEVPCGRL